MTNWVPLSVYSRIDKYILERLRAGPEKLVVSPEDSIESYPGPELSTFFALRHKIFQNHVVDKCQLNDEAQELWNLVSQRFERNRVLHPLEKVRKFASIVLVKFWKFTQSHCNEDMARLVEIRREFQAGDGNSPLSWCVLGLEIKTRCENRNQDIFRLRENEYMNMFNFLLSQVVSFLERMIAESKLVLSTSLGTVFSGLVFNPKGENDAGLYACFRIGRCGDIDPLVGLEMTDIVPLGFVL